jgi:hypothetical protein
MELLVLLILLTLLSVFAMTHGADSRDGRSNW